MIDYFGKNVITMCGEKITLEVNYRLDICDNAGSYRLAAS